MTQLFCETKIPPYKILFTLGIFHAFLGVLYWLLFALGLADYPGAQHAHQMISGFLFSFASGFLLTAVPKFTGTRGCNNLELGIATALVSFVFFSKNPLISLFILTFIALFFLSRFKERSYDPPPHFLFIPTGILMGIIGSFFIYQASLNPMDAAAKARIGKLLLYYGTMLALLLGIGAKMVGALLGWQRPPQHKIEVIQNKKINSSIVESKWFIPIFLVALFTSSYLLEALDYVILGRALRALTGTWISIANWKIYKHPIMKGRLAFWLWIASWFFILGLWAHVFAGDYSIHVAHMIFICGFGLMTLMVASRVILAHGSYPLEIETRSLTYPSIGILLFITVLTRVFAIWTPSYARHLGYAALVWLIALAVWSLFFIPKIMYDFKK